VLQEDGVIVAVGSYDDCTPSTRPRR
jgi:hypothetical protein